MKKKKKGMKIDDLVKKYKFLPAQKHNIQIADKMKSSTVIIRCSQAEY